MKDLQWKLEQLKSENANLAKENETLKAKKASDAATAEKEADTAPAKTEPARTKKFIFF